MTEIKATTKKGQEIISDLHRTYNKRDIYTAYDRPSAAKVRAWEEIRERANNTAGYNHDLQIVGASSHFFSTIYSFIQDGITHIVKDTHANTFHVVVG